ncbi:hypothetical protein [Streptacidiphilus fuscans]|uniref:Uncharacterized protein n=1 Tax=Streptacidiphilus fuscans TaxID=2789292 RepID=A0A931FDT3_9ACTN|nr:hypothetical protein [Streptacidiphilus fuscans]MBF9068465.1 hypothetical protein [Streptacidiphilus fuscans]
MAQVPSSLIAASGLVGGFAIARATKRRELGGVALAAAGGAAALQWRKAAGPRTAAVLGGLYTAAFAGSHPLAKKIGAWPSVLTVATGMAAASWALADRK